jgi:pyrroloquinoline quinone (PQQ) biosynthesis protein C
MSLAEQMKQAIERYATELAERTPIAGLCRRGELTPRAMALYLESLRYLFANSERNLVLAADRCDLLGRSELAQYFRRKSSEEQGHDRWAIADLARLPAAATDGVRPARAVVTLVELQAEFILNEPLCFVAYLQWTEYFSVYVGDMWLDALAMSGYPRAQVTAIYNHLETDRDHSATGFREIDALAQDFPRPRQLLEAVEKSGRVFEALLDEICIEARRAA